MKLNMNVECTPEEARAFLGLPDVTPLNALMVERVGERMQANIEMMDPHDLMSNWMTLGGRMTDQFFQAMGAAATAASAATDDDDAGATPKT